MNGAFNEMANFNGMAALETPEFMAQQDGRARLADVLQPLLGRLGVGDEHAVPVDQAGRLALGRHPQRHHRALAARHRRAGRAALAVHPRHRRRPDDPRGGRPARADDGQRRAAVADGGHQHALHASTTPTRRSATTCSTSRCSATAASTTKGWSAVTKHQHAVGHGRRRRCRRSTTTSGSSTTAAPTTARPATSPPSSPRGSPSCSGCG